MRERIDEPLRQLRALGFEPVVVGKTRGIGAIEGYAVYGLDQFHDVWSATAYARLQIAQHVTTEVGTAFSSRLDDGRFLSTANTPPRLGGPPDVLAHHEPGFDLAMLLDIHRQRVRQTGSAQVVATADEVLAMVAACAAKLNQYNLRRGLLVKLTDEEVRRLGSVKLPE